VGLSNVAVTPLGLTVKWATARTVTRLAGIDVDLPFHDRDGVCARGPSGRCGREQEKRCDCEDCSPVARLTPASQFEA
jgi:hypothetical protein